jgi:hypothetical protein
MPKKIKVRPTAWGFAIAAWDVWRRLPPKQRQQALGLARRHGPKIAKQVVTTTRRSSKTPKKK